MLLVYTPKITNRVRYIFKLLFTDVLGVDIDITGNIDEFRAYNGCKINYSEGQIEEEPFFLSTPLLLDTGVQEQNFAVFEWGKSKAFFKTSDKSALPFDPFAASFYLTSRYEEYLPHRKDKFERFNPDESIAVKNDFLTVPVVNVWAVEIAKIIQTKYPRFAFPQKTFRYIPTIDIDVAYAFLERGWLRTLGGYAKSILYLDIYGIIDRTRVLTGGKMDPFDTYDLLRQFHHKYQVTPICFLLLGDYGAKDKNIPIGSQRMQSLIRSLDEFAEVGIHPSYNASSAPGRLGMEIKRLSEVLNRSITKSRQHFLRLTLPDTYRNLINNGITDDYTMGYASRIGFRAGICTPFWFYDVLDEKETKLKIHPFAIMEGALKDYMRISPENTMTYIQQVIDQVRAVNGTLVSVWHNHSLSEYREWYGWGKVFEEIANEAI